jgi:hypothetical protein
MSAFGGGFNRSVQHPSPRSSAGLIEPQGDPIQVRLRETLEICSPGNTVASSRWCSWLSLLLRHETRSCISLHMRISATGKIRGCCIDRLNRQTRADIGGVTPGCGLSPFDPTATLAVHRGNGFDAGFSPYQTTRLNRYNAGSRA